MQPKGVDLRAIADLVKKGLLKTHIAKIYPFDEMVEAHVQIESRRPAGKIVVKV